MNKERLILGSTLSILTPSSRCWIIDEEIINEYLTKLPVEILTMLNDLEPLFDKIKKYSSSPQKNFE